MSHIDLAGATAVVTGASRGFGRGIVAALSKAGATVVAVARNTDDLAALRADLGTSIIPVAGDAADPVVAGSLIDEYAPRVIVLNAGVNPLVRPLHEQTWDTFARAWHVDVAQAFHWNREALLRPLAPGSAVISMSSGAAIGGSPLSGGYAGAKATVGFISRYAAEESARMNLGIRFVALLPGLSPSTRVGLTGARAYAARAGIEPEAFIAGMGSTTGPDDIGAAVLSVASDDGYDRPAYQVSVTGLRELT